MKDDDPFSSLRPPSSGPSGLPGFTSGELAGAATGGSPDRGSRLPTGLIVIVAVVLMLIVGAVGLGVVGAMSGGGEGAGSGPSAAPVVVADPDVPEAAPEAEPDGTAIGGSQSEGEPAAKQPKRGKKAPRRARSRDLISPAGLTAALATITRKAGGRAKVLSMRVDRERVSFTGANGAGKLTIVTVTPDGQANVVSTGSRAPSFVIALARVDPRAPSRILAATGRKKDLDYFAVSPNPIDGTMGWSVFFKRGTPEFLSAGADGRNPKAPGT